jgi:AbrB family looped-hinge helix DNA binding protein
MATKISIDKRGRILVPRSLRQKLRLQPGDELLIATDGDRITLRPVRPEPLLVKEFGIWVHNGAPSDESIPDMIDREREKRIRQLIGRRTPAQKYTPKRRSEF